jgi:hypothetical protein
MPTLTSTGNVNLTTLTNWSPAQIPQDGDDLIIAAGHTLTADKDFVANTITTNATTSRITISGTPRTLTATNGWSIRSNVLFNTISNSVVNLFGRFNIVSSFGIFNAITNSTVKLSTVGENQSGELIVTTANSFLRLIQGSFDSTSTLTTIGKFNCALSNATALATGNVFNAVVFGTWNHFSVGLNIFRNQFNLRDYNTTFDGNVNINGDFSYERTDNTTNTFSIWSLGGTSRNNVFNGNHTIEDISNSFGSNIVTTSTTYSGTLEINGKFSVKNFPSGSINAQGTCLLLHRNQSYTINSDEAVSISIGASVSLNLTNTQITINGNFFIGPSLTSTVLVDSSTLFSIGATGLGLVNIKLPTLRNKFVRLSSVVPVLPARQYVTAGITYGFSGSELIGTALQLDPAILASAISANIPDIVDGVHEADTRDYDDIPGSIGYEFKKLRQANPFIEFEVTDDITPTDTEFAVSITDFHDDGSFEDSVLCFTEGDLTYDNNPILSLVKHTGYSVITLQRPMRVAPTVGNKGIIDPLSHVHSIEAIQEGLALETTSQSILTAIGNIPTALDPNDIESIRDGLALETTSQSILTAINEIDVDFTPIETLIDASTQTILAAIAEEDDPTNVVNLQIAIKDQNDIGVAGVYVSIHGTAKSAVTNINGVAELWVNPNTNYNLRFVVPPGYTPLPEENIVVGINDIEELYVSAQIATPSIPEELCELRIYVKSQGTTEVLPLENIRVTAKLIDNYKIDNQDLFINIIDVAESNENGYVALVLLKDTDYVISITKDNSIVIKRILVKTTNNAIQTLSEVVYA